MVGSLYHLTEDRMHNLWVSCVGEGGGCWSADCLLSPMYSPADITFVVARQLIHRLSTTANKYGRDHPIAFHSQIVINRRSADGLRIRI